MVVLLSVRTPPPRPFEGVRRDGRYVCPMCGEDAGLKRGWWHRECAAVWNFTRPSWALRELLAVSERCWNCRERYGNEVDHIRPLYSLTPDERRELKWWLPFNMQLLCRVCHREKSRREAAERAAHRRSAHAGGQIGAGRTSPLQEKSHAFRTCGVAESSEAVVVSSDAPRSAVTA